MTGNGFPINPEGLRSLYGDNVPALHEVRLRSINLNWRGPTVTLRLDLPTLPEVVPQAWEDAGVDTVQCQFQFLAASDISLEQWKPPAVVCIEMTRRGENRRMQVTAYGDGAKLEFICSDAVLVGHISGFKKQDESRNGGRHLFTRKVDSLRHASIPETYEKTFYERL
ncbi:Imm50 family immunity protein [Streptomyces mirabilis]|uniref:Imm50 family immunity protein n=1 Tax=Streptomyces mirabilis TaxID=68239 RepID=UPI003631304C